MTFEIPPSGPLGVPPKARPVQPAAAPPPEPKPAAAPAPTKADGLAMDGFEDPFAAGGDDDEFLTLADDPATTTEDWRAPERPFFDFGHQPRAGTLWRVEPGVGPVWADAGTRVTPAQADRMPAVQRSAYYRAIGQDPAPPRPADPRPPANRV